MAMSLQEDSRRRTGAKVYTYWLVPVLIILTLIQGRVLYNNNNNNNK